MRESSDVDSVLGLEELIVIVLLFLHFPIFQSCFYKSASQSECTEKLSLSLTWSRLTSSFPELSCVMYGSACLAVLCYLNCLGDWHQYIIYCVHCDTQLLIFRFLFFATHRQYERKDNVTNMITITTLY